MKESSAPREGEFVGTASEDIVMSEPVVPTVSSL